MFLELTPPPQRFHSIHLVKVRFQRLQKMGGNDWEQGANRFFGLENFALRIQIEE